MPRKNCRPFRGLQPRGAHRGNPCGGCILSHLQVAAICVGMVVRRGGCIHVFAIRFFPRLGAYHRKLLLAPSLVHPCVLVDDFPPGAGVQGQTLLVRYCGWFRDRNSESLLYQYVPPVHGNCLACAAYPSKSVEKAPCSRCRGSRRRVRVSAHESRHILLPGGQREESLRCAQELRGSPTFRLRPIELLVPYPNDRIPWLGKLGSLYGKDVSLDQDEGYLSAYLGIVGICALAWLLWIAISNVLSRPARPMPGRLLQIV